MWDLKLKGTAVTKSLCDVSRAKDREEIGDFPAMNVCIAIFRAVTVQFGRCVTACTVAKF
jgi:hypothetical protein